MASTAPEGLRGNCSRLQFDKHQTARSMQRNVEYLDETAHLNRRQDAARRRPGRLKQGGHVLQDEIIKVLSQPFRVQPCLDGAGARNHGQGLSIGNQEQAVRLD